MSTTELKIAVIGAGAVGGYYGIMLSRMGHDAHYLLRSDYAHVEKHGFTLKSVVHGEVRQEVVNAYNSSADMPVADIVIVALKTTQNKTVLPKVLPQVADVNSAVILIQNGLGMEEDVAAWFPKLQVAGATALILSRKEKNGIIIHDGYGAIDFGNFSLRNVSVLEWLAAEFRKAGISSTVQDLKLLRWKKLVWNMAFNGLSVVLDANTNVILAQYPHIVKAIMQEVIEAANAHGLNLPFSLITDFFPFTEKMGSYAPSMRFDYLNHQPLELEYLYNRPILSAMAAGVEMKEIRKLYQQLQKIGGEAPQIV